MIYRPALLFYRQIHTPAHFTWCKCIAKKQIYVHTSSIAAAMNKKQNIKKFVVIRGTYSLFYRNIFFCARPLCAKKLNSNFSCLPHTYTQTHTHTLSLALSVCLAYCNDSRANCPLFHNFFLYITNLYPGLHVFIFFLLFLLIAPCLSLTRFFSSPSMHTFLQHINTNVPINRISLHGCVMICITVLNF